MGKGRDIVVGELFAVGCPCAGDGNSCPKKEFGNRGVSKRCPHLEHAAYIF